MASNICQQLRPDKTPQSFSYDLTHSGRPTEELSHNWQVTTSYSSLWYGTYGRNKSIESSMVVHLCQCCWKGTNIGIGKHGVGIVIRRNIGFQYSIILMHQVFVNIFLLFMKLTSRYCILQKRESSCYLWMWHYVMFHLEDMMLAPKNSRLLEWG